MGDGGGNGEGHCEAERTRKWNGDEGGYQKDSIR